MSSGILCSGSEACRSLDPKDRLCPRHNEGSRSWLFDPARLWKAGPARNPNPRQAERRLRAWLRPPPLVLFRPDPPAWLRPHIHREIPGDRSLPPTPNPETPSSAAQKSDAQFRLAKSKTPRRPSHGLSMRKPPTCHVPTYLANIALYYVQCRPTRGGYTHLLAAYTGWRGKVTGCSPQEACMNACVQALKLQASPIARPRARPRPLPRW